MKYPKRNNHESLSDFTHFDAKAIIIRGNARITNTIGAVNKCLCRQICSHKICL